MRQDDTARRGPTRTAKAARAPPARGRPLRRVAIRRQPENRRTREIAPERGGPVSWAEARKSVSDAREDVPKASDSSKKAAKRPTRSLRLGWCPDCSLASPRK